MLAQVVTGSVMHFWDVLSDIYVTLLWWRAGRVDFVVAASCLLLASTLFTGKLGHQYLGREYECPSIRPKSRRILRLCVILLTPLNAHNIVFGYMVAHYGTPDTALLSQDAYISEPGTWAYYNFLWLKGLHTGIESIPLALLTGIDLLTGGGSVGALVKWTSMGLSLFSICFSCSLFSLSNEHYCQLSQTRVWERFLDLFCLMGLDVVWYIIAFGWTVAFVPGIYSSLSIGLGLLLIWTSMFYFWLGFFNPAGKAWPSDAQAYEFVKSCVLPYKEALSWRESIITEVAEGAPSAAWVIPMMSFVSACCGGAVPCLIDLKFALPQPGWSVVNTYQTRAGVVAVVKRTVLLAMCVIHLACALSMARLAFTVCCISAHTYFSLRCHNILPPHVSVFRLVEVVVGGAAAGLGAAVTAALNAFLPSGESAGDDKKREKLLSAHTAVDTAERLRPTGIALSDEEQAFFVICESIIASEQRHTEDRKKKRQRSSFEDVFPSTPRAGTPRSPKGSSSSDELAVVVRDCASWVAQECAAKSSHDLHEVTTLLTENYMPSMLDAATLELCISALRALRSGESAPAHRLAPAAPPNVHAAYAPASLVIEPGCCPVVRIFERPAPGEGASCDAASTASSGEPSFKAVEFSTIADPLIWDRDFDTSTAYSLSKHSEAADFFLSHCWHDDAFAKTSLIRSHLFMQPFCAFVVAASLLLALAFVPGGFMLTDIDHRAPWWLPSVCCFGTGALVLAWGLACHLFALRRGPWRFFKQLFWFDKCCIDQTSEASKKAGIEHLGDSLYRCKRMLIIFSSNYLQRLWCVYELATYSRIIKEHAERVADGSIPASEAKTLKILSLTWGSWWNPRNMVNDATLSEDEKKLLAEFSCVNAKFWKRADQHIVLGKIRESWGSEAAFDAYVHDELPIILQQAKVEFFTQARQVMWQTVVTLFAM